ncbi:MAG: hypothetical protein WHX53_09980 [Anaerolineae bacterium]
MAKPKTRYVCSVCGSAQPKWQGKCPDCGTPIAGRWHTSPQAVRLHGPGFPRPVRF